MALHTGQPILRLRSSRRVKSRCQKARTKSVEKKKPEGNDTTRDDQLLINGGCLDGMFQALSVITQKMLLFSLLSMPEGKR